MLLRDWADVGRPRPREAALADLVRRYLAAFAPAGPEDFARWSGLPVGAAREAWRLVARELTEVRVAGAAAWVPPRGENAHERVREHRAPSVRLLPAFDDYLLGWRSRDLIVAKRHEPLVTPGGGMFRPTAIADGRAVATWRVRGDDAVELRPFEPLPRALRPALTAEVADLGRFMGRELRLA